MRIGWFRQTYIKSESCYRTKLLLTHRRNLKAKFLDLENAIRRSLKLFGIRLSNVGRRAFEQTVRKAVADDPLSVELMDAMLSARRTLARVLPVGAPASPCRAPYGFHFPDVMHWKALARRFSSRDSTRGPKSGDVLLSKAVICFNDL